MGFVLRVPLVGIGFLHSAIDLNGKPPFHVKIKEIMLQGSAKTRIRRSNLARLSGQTLYPITIVTNA